VADDVHHTGGPNDPVHTRPRLDQERSRTLQRVALVEIVVDDVHVGLAVEIVARRDDDAGAAHLTNRVSRHQGRDIAPHGYAEYLREGWARRARVVARNSVQDIVAEREPSAATTREGVIGERNHVLLLTEHERVHGEGRHAVHGDIDRTFTANAVRTTEKEGHALNDYGLGGRYLDGNVGPVGWRD